MSKSKRNTVDPDDIIGTYGADTARWFMLSDSPPDRDVIWSEERVQGASRFVQRLWRLTNEAAAIAKSAPAERPAAFGPEALAVRKAAHGALDKVSTGGTESRSFMVIEIEINSCSAVRESARIRSLVASPSSNRWCAPSVSPDAIAAARSASTPAANSRMPSISGIGTEKADAARASSAENPADR